MTILDRAIWLEDKYRDTYYNDVGVCEIGEFTKDSREGWFNQLIILLLLVGVKFYFTQEVLKQKP